MPKLTAKPLPEGTPLALAAFYKWPDMCGLLLRLGADKFKKNK
jgi:hypothetical protein